MEEFCLGHGVLTGGGIENQQHLMGSVGANLSDAPVDLLELFHEVHLGMKPSGRIHQNQVGTPGRCG